MFFETKCKFKKKTIGFIAVLFWGCRLPLTCGVDSCVCLLASSVSLSLSLHPLSSSFTPHRGVVVLRQGACRCRDAAKCL